MRIVSWNLNFRGRETAKRQGGLLRELAPDLMLLQELNPGSSKALAAAAGADWMITAMNLGNPGPGVLPVSGGTAANGRRTNRNERSVSDVLQVIKSRHAEPLSIAELAGVACISPYHFIRIFRDVVGATPYQYLLRTRLRCAAINLGTTKEPISAVAFDAGFGDLSTFAELFRRVFDLSPGQYREEVNSGRLRSPVVRPRTMHRLRSSARKANGSRANLL